MVLPMANIVDFKKGTEGEFSPQETAALNAALVILRGTFNERVQATALGNGFIAINVVSQALVNEAERQARPQHPNVMDRTRLSTLRQSPDFSFENCDEETRLLYMNPAYAELISEADLATLWMITESNFSIHNTQPLLMTVTHPKATAEVLNKIAAFYATRAERIDLYPKRVREGFQIPFVEIMKSPLVDSAIKKTLFKTRLFPSFIFALGDFHVVVEQVINNIDFSADEVREIFASYQLTQQRDTLGKSKHVTDPSLYNLYLESGDDNAILSIIFNPYIGDDVKELAKSKLSPTTRGYLESGDFK